MKNIKTHTAQITKSSKRIFECRLIDTNKTVTATALRMVVKTDHPVVGDIVDVNQVKNEYEIVAIHSRHNSLFRRIVRTNQTKYFAANVDLIIVVASVSKPAYKPFLIDRYLLRATQWDIPVIVVMNKMDEFDEQFDLEFEKKRLDHLGVGFFEISSTRPSLNEQHAKLKSLLQKKLTICIGQSGVGKSHLISSLSQGEVELLSSRLSKKVSKGAHTTSWSEIVNLGEFSMIDSPGVRSLSIQDINLEELDQLYFDLVPYFNKCQFNNCLHFEQSKGCAFDEVDGTTDEGLIVFQRLESYQRIKEEISKTPSWQK